MRPQERQEPTPPPRRLDPLLWVVPPLIQPRANLHVARSYEAAAAHDLVANVKQDRNERHRIGGDEALRRQAWETLADEEGEAWRGRATWSVSERNPGRSLAR